MDQGEPQNDVVKFCKNCGNPVKPETNFCSRCGTQIRETDQTQAGIPPPSQIIQSPRYIEDPSQTPQTMGSEPVASNITISKYTGNGSMRSTTPGNLLYISKNLSKCER